MKLLKFSLSVALFVLAFYLLIVGQDLLLPLVIAIVFWYLINMLADAFLNIPLGDFRLPRWSGYVLSIACFGLVIWGLVKLVSMNIDGVMEVAPSYQANLEQRINSIVASLPDFLAGYVELVTQYIEQIDIGDMIIAAASSLTNVAADSGVILIYIVFLIMEQGSFNQKISSLFKDPEKEKNVRKLLARVKGDVKKYFGIKMLTSSLTGILSYAFLKFVGVDFAAFWAMLIFLLNFIPTIGSIVATIFPSLITLVQFETFTPFFIVVVGVTSIQVMVGNLLEPRLMGNSLNLSPLIILLNLSLWGIIWGIPGMFLCVPILVISMIFFSHIPQLRGIAVILSRNGQLTHDEN